MIEKIMKAWVTSEAAGAVEQNGEGDWGGQTGCMQLRPEWYLQSRKLVRGLAL